MSLRNILAGNWKMNLGISESVELARQLAALSSSLTNTYLWAAPSAMALKSVNDAVAGTRVWCGAQNVHWEDKGAFTGELSAPILLECGCRFAIVGHSERRHIFGETNEIVAKRCLGAIDSGLMITLCIGETLAEREQGRTAAILQEQLAPIAGKLSPEAVPNLVIAYEPVWAIGTGKVATVNEIAQAHAAVAAYWATQNQALCPPILYGGSVSPENFAEIIRIDLVAGALIGGASLSFAKMQAMAEISELC